MSEPYDGRPLTWPQDPRSALYNALLSSSTYWPIPFVVLAH